MSSLQFTRRRRFKGQFGDISQRFAVLFNNLRLVAGASFSVRLSSVKLRLASRRKAAAAVCLNQSSTRSAFCCVRDSSPYIEQYGGSPATASHACLLHSLSSLSLHSRAARSFTSQSQSTHIQPHSLRLRHFLARSASTSPSYSLLHTHEVSQTDRCNLTTARSAPLLLHPTRVPGAVALPRAAIHCSCCYATAGSGRPLRRAEQWLTRPRRPASLLCALSRWCVQMSGWDAYINALRGDGSVINGAAIYGQVAHSLTHSPASARRSNLCTLRDASNHRPASDDRKSIVCQRHSFLSAASTC